MTRLPACLQRPRTRDWLLAAGFLALGQLEAWTVEVNAGAGSIDGPRWTAVATTTLLALALLWRRTRPLESSLAVTVLMFGSADAWGVGDTIAATGVGLLCSAFALAVYAPQRLAVVGLVAVPVAMIVTSVRVQSLGDWLWVAGLYAVVWSTGRIVRSRQEGSVRGSV